MAKIKHEIRDAIHVFVRLDTQERQVLDSRPFQRLRFIHQLAMTYLVYPGASHKRFEHSLGVMELAGKVFDVVTAPENVLDEIKRVIPEISDEDKRRYWRRVLRMAALCHDLGHLPFSHAAEDALLPNGWDHEKLTREIILSDEMQEIWKNQKPPLDGQDIVKLSLGKKKAPDLEFSDWESILSEIIVGDAFGVDRMDYLLRDSHHAGVVYGKFDHHRLIDTLRILPPPSTDRDSSKEPSLGIEEGGIQSAEALLLARYFMFSQVYFHPIRRIYDIHLRDFLLEWLPEHKFSTDIDKHLCYTDNEVSSAISKAALKEKEKGHIHAKRIVTRKHFKVLEQRNPEDQKINPQAVESIYNALKEKYGGDLLRYDSYKQKGKAEDFPVKTNDNRITHSIGLSMALQRIPVVAIDYIFADRGLMQDALEWIGKNRRSIIEASIGEEDE